MSTNSDSVQLDLPTVDWDNLDSAAVGGGSFPPPPQATDAEGKAIVYFGQVESDFPEDAFGQSQAGALKAKIDTITLVNNGPGIDGQKLRFTSISSKLYQDRKTGEPRNSSQMIRYFQSAGVTYLKPQTEAEYKAAVRATKGKLVAFTVDWECYDKQTKTSVVKGYDSFAGPAGAKDPVVQLPDGRKLIARAQVRNFVTP